MEEKTKLLPITNDYIFKRVFSYEGNEDVLKDLLEAILEIKINKVEVKNPEIIGDTIGSKKGVLDIKAEINEDTIVDVEIQVGNVAALERRLVVYDAKLITGDLKASETYQNAKDTIVICIVNNEIIRRNAYLSVAMLKYLETEKIRYVDRGYKQEDEYLTDMVKYYIIEIPKFKEKKPKVADLLEKWLYVIGGNREMMEEYKKEEGEIKEAIEQLEEMSADEKEREMYEARQKAIWAYNSGMYDATQKGLERGRREGIKEGREKGRKEGIQEGREEERKKVAKKLLQMKLPIEQIMEITGLKEDEIKDLKSVQ